MAVFEILDGFHSWLMLDRIFLADHSVYDDLTLDSDATLCGLVEDALNALDEEMILTRLNLVLALCVSLDIFVVYKTLDFEFTAGL